MIAMNLKRRCQRTAPFLHQNWIAGVSALQNSVMGGALSTGAQKHLAAFAEDEDATRPPKRQRLSTPDSFDVEHLIASPQASDQGSTLRIDVHKIQHKDSKKVRHPQVPAPTRDVLTTKANCRVAIYDASSFDPRPLWCLSQVCEVVSYKNPVGPHRVARINLPRPFHVPEESILINRADDNSYDFSHSYKLVVEVESAACAAWPPLDASDFGSAMGDRELLGESKRQWIMSTEMQKVFGRVNSTVSLRPGHNQPCRETDYVMDVDLRWTKGFRALKRLEQGCKPTITAHDPDVDIYTNGHFEPVMDDDSPVNGIDGINEYHPEEDEAHGPEDELLEGDQTPSRSLRTRERNKVYNLKVLSDQAQGKERKRRGRPGQVPSSEGRVTYYIPKDQPFDLNFFRCAICGEYHQSLPLLQLHLQMSHTNYDCVFEMSSQGPQFRISRRLEIISTPAETYQLTRPVQPFDLQSLIAGDQSWITSRLGPVTGEEPARSPSKKSAQVRQSSDRSGSQSSQSRQVEPVERKIIIPDNLPQPLFDPVSKAKLNPGDELPNAAAERAWLYHKHRECLDDYTDMTDNEVEYIKKWDEFILHRNITASAYFPRAWIAFAQKEASWLVAAQRRMIEFSKHASFLFTRDVLDDEAINEALKHINAARAEAKSQLNGMVNGVKGEEAEARQTTPKQSPPRNAQIRKGANGCKVCQLPVLGPRLLVCANKACKQRLYHSDCIEEDALTPVTLGVKWVCNSCTEQSGSS